jgi:phenylpyruvate tautomerase PptA (4-oxalocrotonate tautomerase family)
MPFIHLKVAGPTLAPEQIQRLQQRLTALSDQTFDPVSGPAAVLIEPVAIAGWSIDGKPVQIVAHLEIKAPGNLTPTARQKATLVEETATLLRRVLGAPLESLSFVIIEEHSSCHWSTSHC